MKTWVLDTNVVISGLISRSGPCAALVDAFFSDRLRLGVDRRIIEEYGEVMERPKFGISSSERSALLLKLQASAVRVTSIAVTIALPDDDDRPFVEVALACPEKAIVTRNLKDFAGVEKLGIRLLPPEEAIAELNDGRSA